MTSDERASAGINVAVTRVGTYAVGIEVDRIAEILDAAGTEADVHLDALVGAPESAGGPRKLLRLSHGGAELLLAVHGAIEVGHRVSGPCQRPALVAAAFERCCMRGVLRDGDRLVYVLDVDGVARRLTELRQDGGSPCESD